MLWVGPGQGNFLKGADKKTVRKEGISIIKYIDSESNDTLRSVTKGSLCQSLDKIEFLPQKFYLI